MLPRNTLTLRRQLSAWRAVRCHKPAGTKSTSEIDSTREPYKRLRSPLDLSYTVFDFGARRGRINAAKAQLLAANFSFNDSHRNVIYQVEQSCYRLSTAMGKEEAVRASLFNAATVQEAAEARLAHGLATPARRIRGPKRYGPS